LKHAGGRCSSDLLAKHPGARGLRGLTPVVLGVEASTPSRGVPPAVDDAAGVTVAGMPAHVTDSLPYGNSPDALVHRGCPRTERYDCLALPYWWCVHRNFAVLVHGPARLLRGF